MIDVVCYYADFGRPYQPLMERMCASAKKHLRCRTVILTPTPREWMSAVFDTVAPHRSSSYHETNKDNLCQQRAEAMMSWGALCNRDAIFVDPDIEFRAAPIFDDSFAIGLLWRPTKMSMPINTGAILCRPGQKDFWMRYGNTVVNLPLRIHGWWCDQIGFALMTGTTHPTDTRLEVCGAKVWLMNAADHCDTPENITESAWAVHFKGKRKGPEWVDIFETDVLAQDRKIDSGLDRIRVTA